MRDFVARFNAATLEVRDLNADMAISAIKRYEGIKIHLLSRQDSLRPMLNFWSARTSIVVRMKLLLTDARQTKKVRKRSRRKLKLRSNQIGRLSINELHLDDGVRSQTATASMTHILFFLFSVHRS